MRSLMYVYYYLWDAGISQTPWNDPNVFVIASGDDVIIFIRNNLADAAEDAILARTARNINLAIVGLGQCVKTIKKSFWWDFDFCSCFSYSSGNDDDWILVRDASKIIRTKQFFTNQNKAMLLNPVLHRLAIYIGVKSEQISHLIEDILLHQIRLLQKRSEFLIFEGDETMMHLLYHVKYIKYGNSPNAYEHEQIINEQCGISSATLWNLYENDVILCGPLGGARQILSNNTATTNV